VESDLSGTFVIRICYQKQETCDQQLRETRGRLKAISVPYDIIVQRDGERSVSAGTLRLTLNGKGRLARVAIRRMKAPFPFLQMPLQNWLSRFVGEEFSCQRVAELGLRLDDLQ
jgi:hypothetical protein